VLFCPSARNRFVILSEAKDLDHEPE